MGRPKAEKRSDTYTTGNVYAIRGTAEWKARIDALAAKTGTGVPALIDRALIELNHRMGEPPLPRRTAPSSRHIPK